MQYFTPFIGIKAKKIESISKHLCDQEEILYASKIHFNFPPSRNLPAQTGYVILTCGFIYLFTKDAKEIKLEERICLFNCQEIKFINEKGKNSKAAVLIKTLPDQNLFTIFDGKKMEILYEYLTQCIHLISNGLTSQINIPKLTPAIQLEYLPIPYAIFRRALYFIHIDMKQQKLPQTTIDGASYFNNPKIYHQGQLLIDSSFHPGNYTFYFAKAIGLDSRIYKIIFQEFCDDFMNFFEALLMHASKIQQIKFSDYITSAPVFNFERINRSNTATYEFFNSSFYLLENFMNGCISYNRNITDIKLSSLAMQQADLINVFDNLNKIKCFNNLSSFGLFNMQFGQFPFEVFKEFLSLHPKLESLYFNAIDVEGSTLLSEICSSQTDIHQLHLNQLNFDNPLNLKEGENEGQIITSLPKNLVLADFSHSKFKNITLKPLLELLTSQFPNREFASTDLMVNMSYLQPRENTFVNTFKGLDHTKCQPNIADLNWSGNNLSLELFSFLSTQKKLHFLSLMDIHIDKPKNFFQSLTKLIKETPIIGIDLGSSFFSPEFIIPFFATCSEMRKLQHFFFHCQPEQNEIAEKLADMFSMLTNLKEVAVNISKLNKETYLKLANSIVQNKSIVACNLMNYDNDKKDLKRVDLANIAIALQNMRTVSLMEQRAAILIANKSTSFSLASTIEAKCNKLDHVDLLAEDY